MRVRMTSEGVDGRHGGLIETEGFWINMNMETGAPSRLEDRFFELLATTTDERRLRWKAWLTAPLVAQTERPFPLRRGDADRLDHVNNAVYLQAMREVFPLIPEVVTAPHRLVIEYNEPIVYGEDVRIATAPPTVGSWCG